MAELKKIFVDAGHGGSDPGAVKYEKEADLNIKVTGYMCDYLSENYECEVKKDITADSINTVVARANKWGADLFVSNHKNAGGGDGYEAWVYSEKNKKLGEIFAKHVKAAGQNLRSPSVKYSTNLGVLRLTNMKAILNEGAFVDNKKDIQDWNEAAELKKLGKAYAEAAAEYLDLPKKKATSGTSKPASTSKSATKLTVDGIKGPKTIKAWQKYLNKVGYSCGTADGIMGAKTIKATQKFLNAKGYKCGNADGIMGAKTIKALQKFLNAKGYSCGTADGIMGKKTVKAWQKYINSTL